MKQFWAVMVGIGLLFGNVVLGASLGIRTIERNVNADNPKISEEPDTNESLESLITRIVGEVIAAQ